MPNDDTSANSAAMRRWFEEVWNRGRADVIDEMFAADGLCHGLADDGSLLVGPAAFKRFYAPMRAAFPDIHVVVEDIVAAGDQTVARLSARGTHTGNGLGLPPTGRTVSFTAMVWTRWKNGRIVEGWNELDSASLLRQLTPAGEIGASVAVKAR